MSLPDRRTDELKRTIASVMDGRPSLGREGLLGKLERMLDAQRTVFATHEGRISDERSVPDNSAQLRALNMAFALRDEYPHKAAVNVGVALRMEQLPDLSQLSVRELQVLAGIDGIDGDEAAADTVDADSTEQNV